MINHPFIILWEWIKCKTTFSLYIKFPVNVKIRRTFYYNNKKKKTHEKLMDQLCQFYRKFIEFSRMAFSKMAHVSLIPYMCGDIVTEKQLSNFFRCSSVWSVLPFVNICISKCKCIFLQVHVFDTPDFCTWPQVLTLVLNLCHRWIHLRKIHLYSNKIVEGFTQVWHLASIIRFALKLVPVILMPITMRIAQFFFWLWYCPDDSALFLTFRFIVLFGLVGLHQQ